MTLHKVSYDFNLTVSPDFYGEYLDALGLKNALERKGFSVKLTEIPVIRNIKRPVYIDGGAKFNINFHSCYHPSEDARYNFLFYHEVHDKTGPDDVKIPLGTFGVYNGVFTPALRFASELGINNLRMAVDEYLYYPVLDVPNHFKCDVCFIGNNHPSRRNEGIVDYIQPMLAAGVKVHVYGNGWNDIFGGNVAKGVLGWHEARLAYSGAKVGLNAVVKSMGEWGLGTNRLYQMSACGLPSVSYRVADYECAYPEGVTWAFSPEEFVKSTIHLLDNEEERKKNGKIVYGQTLKSNTWGKRVYDLLNILENPEQGFRNIRVRPGQEYWNEDIMIAIMGGVRDNIGMSYFRNGALGRPSVRFALFNQQREYAIDVARTKMVRAFLEGKYRYLLFLDNDLILPGGFLDKMLSNIVNHDFAIVSGWYKRTEPIGPPLPHVYVSDADGNNVQVGKFPSDKFVMASLVPAGCLMIKREVLDTFAANKTLPFWDTRMFEKDDMGGFGGLSEDMWFCRKAREFGYKIIVDPALYCKHVKEVIYEKTNEQMF